jgi:hypothetical protein
LQAFLKTLNYCRHPLNGSIFWFSGEITHNRGTFDQLLIAF